MREDADGQAEASPDQEAGARSGQGPRRQEDRAGEEAGRRVAPSYGHPDDHQRARDQAGGHATHHSRSQQPRPDDKRSEPLDRHRHHATDDEHSHRVGYRQLAGQQLA